MKSKLRLNASGFSIINSTPPFANTMLAEVVFIPRFQNYMVLLEIHKLKLDNHLLLSL